MAKIPDIFCSDANGYPSQFARPVKSLTTKIVDAAADVTFVKEGYWTVISTTNFWWRWGSGLFEPLIYAIRGDEESGLWPANEPLSIYVQAGQVFAFVKHDFPGYITFYKNYGG
jgi:hypothetical protein